MYERWRRLVNANESRWTVLREAEKSLKSVDDLLLAFAKKSYELNSWFENAEEDLSDPVRCYSIDEINDLFKAQDVFLDSLDQIVKDLNEIKELDATIKRSI